MPVPKPCQFDNIDFPSMRAAAKHFGVSVPLLRDRMRRGLTGPPTRKQDRSRPCTLAGIKFPSMNAAARHFDVNPNTVKEWIRRGVTDPDICTIGTIPDMRILKIYGWKHKPSGKIKYVGRTIQSLERREGDYRNRDGGSKMALEVQARPDDWEMVPIKEYPDITPAHPDYRDLARAKEQWWIRRKKTMVSQGGFNTKASGKPATRDYILTDEEMEEIIALYQTGEFSYQALGRKFGVGGATIERHLSRAGIKRVRVKRKDSPAVAAKKKEARRLRKKGLTYPKIAARVGLSETTVTRACEGLAPVRHQGVKTSPEVADRILAQAGKGVYAAEIARRENVCIRAVMRIARHVYEAKYPELAQVKKPIVFGGIEFDSHAECAKHFGIITATLKRWIKRGLDGPPPVTSKSTRGRTNRGKAVRFGGIKFKSLTDCATHFGVSAQTLAAWRRKGLTEPPPLTSRSRYGPRKPPRPPRKDGRKRREKPITFGGIDFPTRTACRDHFGVSPGTLIAWLKKGLTEPPPYKGKRRYNPFGIST